MKPQRTRGGGGPRPDIHPPDWQTHKQAENFFDKKRERSRLAAKNKCASALVGDLMPASAPKTRAIAEAATKKGHFYKPLPKLFRRDGFDYRQIAHESDAAVYEQRWKGCVERSVCYDVIRIKQREGFEINGRFIEAAEIYPRSEAWGVNGWTLVSRDAAFQKLREMCR
jgi:hypothetical protein